MTQPQPTKMPIGYWLKKVDQLLTDRINEIQATNGLSRLEWQTLNTLFEKESVTETDLHNALSPFADTATLRPILVRFAALNWLETTQLETEPKIYRLSRVGQAQHQQISQAQQAIRAHIMQGITADHYTIVIQTLQQMAANLEISDTLADNG